LSTLGDNGYKRSKVRSAEGSYDCSWPTMLWLPWHGSVCIFFE
jgi:hypothetical protein